MYEPVHEKIQVIAEFSAGKGKVKSFTWRDKDYQVIEQTLEVKASHGRETVWIFYVVTESAAFKLRLDTDSLNWYLEEFTWQEGDS